MEFETERSWIEHLAKEEDSNNSNPSLHQDRIQVRTKEFLLDLKSTFESFVVQFNDLKKDESDIIRIYKMSDGKSDFMLFRKNFQLLFSENAPGIIQIAFIKKSSGGLNEERSNSYLDAYWNPHLSTVNWKHREHSSQFVDTKNLARHYLEAFVRESSSL